MNSFRLNRLFHPVSRRCFDVAIDHGFFNELGFLSGIEDIGAAVRTVVQANPDAIQLTVGQAHHLQSLPGRLKPSLVLRLDVANVYGKKLPRRLYSQMIADPVEQALRLDAACMCVNLFQIPGEPEVGEQCIENILRLKPACERYGMPMMVEPLVRCVQAVKAQRQDEAPVVLFSPVGETLRHAAVQQLSLIHISEPTRPY